MKILYEKQLPEKEGNGVCIQQTGTKLKPRLPDGCGGQNKNSLIIGMASKWLLCHAPPQVQTLEFYFPVTGHSFIPADKLFARIEKRVK
uniref:Uncharacterized protein n=1 Tax=Timema poppense TaxID=170557 RepID=A0A7R9HI49_TIMPO|nr:unnamed protein product [Timema poppensis]